MVHTAFTENPKKKPAMFTSILTTRHQSLNKFQSIEKSLPIFSSSKNIFQELTIYYYICRKNSGYKTKNTKLTTKRKQSKQKEKKP